MKVTKSISLELEYVHYMDEHNLSLSRWVNQKMKEEFKSKEVRIKELEEDIGEKQREINSIKQEDSRKVAMLKEKIDNLSEDAKKELIDANESIGRDNSYFEGRFGRYRKLFDKTVTIDEYKILLNNIKK